MKVINKQSLWYNVKVDVVNFNHIPQPTQRHQNRKVFKNINKNFSIKPKTITPYLSVFWFFSKK